MHNNDDNNSNSNNSSGSAKEETDNNGVNWSFAWIHCYLCVNLFFTVLLRSPRR